MNPETLKALLDAGQITPEQFQALAQAPAEKPSPFAGVDINSQLIEDSPEQEQEQKDYEKETGEGEESGGEYDNQVSNPGYNLHQSESPSPTGITKEKTPVSEPELISTLAETYKQQFGKAPSPQQLAVLKSHIDLETAHGKSMWHYNVGNITTSGKDHAYYDDLPTDEQVKPGQWEKRNLKYRAYDDLQQGMSDYLQFLERHYPEAWKAAQQGDAAAFSKGLKKRGYYTANEAPYTKGMEALTAQNLKRIGQ